MGEECVEERNFISFFVCPATTLSSAALAEIAFCALAFSLLLYCRRVIRIIYCLAARFPHHVENVSNIFGLYIQQICMSV